MAEPDDFWYIDEYPNDPTDCEHCFCISTGDVEWVGEPHYGWGIVWECCMCGLQQVFFNQDLTDQILDEEMAEEENEGGNGLAGPVSGGIKTRTQARPAV